MNVKPPKTYIVLPSEPVLLLCRKIRISQRNIIKYCCHLQERKEKQPVLRVPETEPKHHSGATSCAAAAVTNLDSETLAEKPPLCKSRGSAAGNHRVGLGGTWKKGVFWPDFSPFVLQ